MSLTDRHEEEGNNERRGKQVPDTIPYIPTREDHTETPTDRPGKKHDDQQEPGEAR